jgi:hypothetical protein
MQEITIIIYENKGGMDVFPCKNRDVANALALAIVQENRQYHSIPSSVTDTEALAGWSNLTNENIFIQETELIE